MNDRYNEITHTTLKEEEAQSRLWPSHAYTQQVEVLKNAIGKKVFLIELKPSAINMGVHLSGTPYELLEVVDFPKPNPSKGIAPHLILLDDGRGINLGRIARITVNKAFSPAESDILYYDSYLMNNFLLRERQLSKASIAARSKALLGRLLGKPTLEQLSRKDDSNRSSVDETEANKPYIDDNINK